MAQDANGDGSPAGETWYELKGSEYGNGKTIFNYEVTYTEQADGSIAWTDNQTPAGSGTIDRIGAHAQASYAPRGSKPGLTPARACPTTFATTKRRTATS